MHSRNGTRSNTNGSLLLNSCIVLVCIIATLSTNQAASIDTDLSNAIVNAISGSPSLLSNNKKVSNNEPIAISSELSPQEAHTISVIMQTMLPSMFGLFSNITSEEYKSNFKDPCRFDVLMDIFKNLPPYFDIIATKYPNKHDLIAYYSMQLASSFLVNNGSLTMACMYNMLSLQTKLFSFSLDIMDNPEKNPQLVGLFGIFMKPVMTMLKKNSMMKIIEHVDRYDKNDDQSTIPLFHFLNFIFVFLGMFAILSNILLVLLLKRSSTARIQRDPSTIVRKFSKKSLSTEKQFQPILINSTLTRKSTQNGIQSESLILNQSKRIATVDNCTNKEAFKTYSTTVHNKRRVRKVKSNKNSSASKYRTIKMSNSRMFYMIQKRYKTRFCFIVIAICHSLYLLINFMIMSQASLAAAALKGLSQFNIMCKLAFFMSPPTTVYNILHQLAIWLLVYAIRQHGIKLRKTRAYTLSAADYELEMMKNEDDYVDDDEKYNLEMDLKTIESEYEEKEAFESSASDDEDTVSVSLTNNSNNLILMSQSSGLMTSTVASTNQQASSVKFKMAPDGSSYSNYHQILNHQRHPIIQFTPTETQIPISTSKRPLPPIINSDQLIPAQHTSIRMTNKSNEVSSFFCYLFSHKRKNVLFCLVLFFFICLYDSQNFFFYSLSKLEGKDQTLYFCAFESAYAEYYTVLNQYILPIANLCLFSFFPLLLCTMQVLFDVCFLVRVQREQMKRYERLKDVIEWPLYAYYAMYMISQVPLGLHQIIDLASGTVKFPFVFPLFIQLKFTSKVWLNVIEMLLVFICYSSDLYIWMLCDKQIRKLAAYWLNKRIFCRTYKQKRSNLKTEDSNNRRGVCGASSSSGNIDGSSSVGSHCSSSCSSSEGFSCNRSNSANMIGKSEVIRKESKNRIYKKQQPAINTISDKKLTTNIDLKITKQINSSGSSTVSSSASSSSNIHKKQISPIILAAADTVAASAKATAAISASMGSQLINEQINKNPTKNSIKMIDTDNDDIDDIIDIDGQTKLSKLNEEKELDSSQLHQAYSEKPPSFYTAIRNKADKRQNQYQNNIDFTQINQVDGSD